MAKKIEGLASQIEKLEQGICEAYDEDYATGALTAREATPADICEQLNAIVGEIRSIAWSPAYEAEAKELAKRANREIDRLCQVHDLLR